MVGLEMPGIYPFKNMIFDCKNLIKVLYLNFIFQVKLFSDQQLMPIVKTYSSESFSSWSRAEIADFQEYI